MNMLKDRITQHPFFRNFTPDHIDTIIAGATERHLKAGTTLFHEGEPATQFFLIESGTVAVESHGPSGASTNVQTVGPGEVVGWSWLFPPFVWHFQARVLEPTQVIVLDGAHLLVSAERDPKLGYEVMKRVSHVVIERLQAARKKLLALQIGSRIDG